MSSRADSLASRSALLGNGEERTMTAISGLRCYGQYGKSSPLSSLVRTLLESCRWYSPAARLRWTVKPLSSTRITTFMKDDSSSSSKPSAPTSKPRDIPSNRLLFRLVPSVRHTEETVCGSSPSGEFPHLLMTPTTREFCESPESMRERADRKGYKNGTKYNSLLSQVIYSGLLPTPVTQGLKVCENGKQKFLSLGLLPTPLAVDIQHPQRIEKLKAKGGQTMGSRANGELRPNGLMDFLHFYGLIPTPNASDATVGSVIGERDRIVMTPSGVLRKVTPKTNFSLGLARFVQLLPTPNAAEATKGATTYNPQSQMGKGLTAMALNGMLPTPCAQDFKKRGVNSHHQGLPEMFRWLLTPSASDGLRSVMTMDHLKAHKKHNAERSNLSEQIAHKVGGGSSQLSPLFVEEMMGYPLMFLVLPFLSPHGAENL